MSNIQELSNIEKEKIYEIEKQNIENIKEKTKQAKILRKNEKNGLVIKQFKLLKAIVYEITSTENKNDVAYLISPSNLAGLSWGDLEAINQNNVWQTNIKNGIWISSSESKIKYTIAKNKNVIVGVELQKIENVIEFACYSKISGVEEKIVQNTKNEVLLVNVLDKIEYPDIEIKQYIKELKQNCITIDQNEIEKEILIQEKEKLQKNVDSLKEQINIITQKIDQISKQADIAEKESKKAMAEIGRVTKENENLKNSIVNVRRAVTKKCAYIPIVGRIIIKELNKEFGENALPNG